MPDCLPVRELLTHIIGGGWGSESADDVNEQQVAIIRGADFPQIQVGNASSLPMRFESRKRVESRKLQDGDIVLEISGGTNERPTGRSVFVSKSMLSQVPVPVIPASFCRLLRPDPSVVEPRYLYYWLQDMFAQGRTWAYQVRSTGIANFQTEYFLDQELVTLPGLAEQRRIAGVLGALDDLIEVNRGLINDLLATVNADFERRFGQRELSLRLDALAVVIDCLHSKKPARVTSGHRLLQLSNILDSGQLDIDDMYGITAEDYLRWTKNIETREWDCVITNVGRVGAVARIPAGVAAALGRNMTAIRPKAPDGDGAFILAALLSRPVRREITLKTDSGTVMDALNVKNIPSLRLPQASPGERSEFHAFARPLLLAADSLKNEVTEIQATRDELLPLLMSGRVRVTEEVAA